MPPTDPKPRTDYISIHYNPIALARVMIKASTLSPPRGEGFKSTLIEDAIGRLFGSSPLKGFLARRDAEVGQSVTLRGCKSSVLGRCHIRSSGCTDVLVRGDLGIEDEVSHAK